LFREEVYLTLCPKKNNNEGETNPPLTQGGRKKIKIAVEGSERIFFETSKREEEKTNLPCGQNGSDSASKANSLGEMPASHDQIKEEGSRMPKKKCQWITPPRGEKEAAGGP